MIADCTQKLYKKVKNMPICLEKAKFNPKRNYDQCACGGTKVDGKCMFNKLCKKEAVVYKVTDQPTGFSYIGKAQGGLSKKTNMHVNGMKAFWNLGDRDKKYTAKTASNNDQVTTPKKTERNQAFLPKYASKNYPKPQTNRGYPHC